MKQARTVTFILVPILIGLIIGALLQGNATLLVVSILLLVADGMIGIGLQYAKENGRQRDGMTAEERVTVLRFLL